MYSISSQNFVVVVVVGSVLIVLVCPDETVEPIADTVTSVVSVEPDVAAEVLVSSSSDVVFAIVDSVVSTFNVKVSLILI